LLKKWRMNAAFHNVADLTATPLAELRLPISACRNYNRRISLRGPFQMGEYCYVDNSNVYIEGQRVSAVQKGMAMNIFDAINTRILDSSYRMDFGKLHAFIAGDDPTKIKRAMLFGSRPPANDSLWKIAKQVGFEVVVEDRNVANKEKRIDTGIVAAMTKDAYTKVEKDKDTITLVAGDGDFVPAVRQLKEDGFTMEVVFWGHVSADLRTACATFVSLNKYLDYLAR
jgi:uncharacterized LabA/DUF88 family protein